MWPADYSDLEFELPEDLIAKYPAEPADHARLMVIDRRRQSILDDRFYNLGKYIAAGDAIIYNATQVEERRIYLRTANSERKFECVFLARAPNEVEIVPGHDVWHVLMKNIRRLPEGTRLYAVKNPAYRFTLRRTQDKIFLESDRPLSTADFAVIGEMPLPPYMKRAATMEDSTAYQNFFKQQIAEKHKIQGSAASPTAALHFTQNLFHSLRQQGIGFYPLCLDIGYGTFAPLTAQNFASNTLHSEHYFIPQATAALLAQKSGAARRIALGTTSLRAILSYHAYGLCEGETRIFLKPGDTVTGVEGLITNFHLPRSSLILLVAAFAGRDLISRAYREALERRYRFFSYGDAMLII